jgi:3-oxoacyl-[acyl-carrier protein] reductase
MAPVDQVGTVLAAGTGRWGYGMDLALQGKVAIVTGAGRGLGKAIAGALAGEGVRLALLDVDWPVEAVASSETAAGSTSLILQVDVAQGEAVRAAVARVQAEFGRIDILVNNAGIASFTMIPDISEQEWDHVLAVNLRSVLLMSQAVFPIMRQQGGGVIVNMTSMAGKVGGLKIGPAYSASKAGIICLTISLARSGAAAGIRVNAVAPAFIESAMMPAARRDEYVPLIPLGRMGTPADVAAAVLFLASERAGFITGEIMDVNGGALMD